MLFADLFTYIIKGSFTDTIVQLLEYVIQCLFTHTKIYSAYHCFMIYP